MISVKNCHIFYSEDGTVQTFIGTIDLPNIGEVQIKEGFSSELAEAVRLEIHDIITNRVRALSPDEEEKGQVVDTHEA